MRIKKSWGCKIGRSPKSLSPLLSWKEEKEKVGGWKCGFEGTVRVQNADKDTEQAGYGGFGIGEDVCTFFLVKQYFAFVKPNKYRKGRNHQAVRRSLSMLLKEWEWWERCPLIQFNYIIIHY